MKNRKIRKNNNRKLKLLIMNRVNINQALNYCIILKLIKLLIGSMYIKPLNYAIFIQNNNQKGTNLLLKQKFFQKI